MSFSDTGYSAAAARCTSHRSKNQPHPSSNLSRRQHEQAVESLKQQGLVEVIKHGTIDEPQLDLPRAGRDLVVGPGLVTAAQDPVSS
jgi:biotin synthase-related radical SAM superfamily protein